MALQNWMCDTREAIWDALDKDPDFRALTAPGTRFRFETGILQRFEIKPAQCPVVAIYPASADLAPLSRRVLEDEIYRLSVVLITSGDNVSHAEQLLLAFWAALLADWTNIALVRDSDLTQIDIENLIFSFHPGEQDARPMWSVEFSLGCQFQAERD